MFVPFVFNMSTLNKAPFLWWFCQGLDFAKKTQSAIIAQEVYCKTPLSAFVEEGRSEVFNKAIVDEHWGYQLPKNRDLSSKRIYEIPDSILDPIIKEKGSIADAFCYLLTQVDSGFCTFLDNLIERIEAECDEAIEGFITLIAIPSLTEVAHARGKQIIHFEMGCWREPLYMHTAFWDLEDLQGGHSVEKRYKRFCEERNEREIPLFSKKEILSVLLRKENLPLLNQYNRQPVKKIGVALGYTTYELISSKTHLNDSELLYRVKKKYGLEDMLIRRHFGDPYGGTYPMYAEAIDQRGRSMPDFLLDCETVVSLLSGTGMEAMLWGRKAITLLPSPSYYASGHEIEGEGKCAGEDFISFFAFCYLIPLEYLTDVNYMRWRLSEPSEREIYFKHLEYYFNKKSLPMELIFSKPGDRLEGLLSAQGFTLEMEGK